MAKKPKLTDALKPPKSPTTTPSTPAPAPDTATQSSRPPGRRGKKTIAGHFDPAVSRQLREIAVAEDTTVQALLEEALNEVFVKRGKPPIA